MSFSHDRHAGHLFSRQHRFFLIASASRRVSICSSASKMPRSLPGIFGMVVIPLGTVPAPPYRSEGRSRIEGIVQHPLPLRLMGRDGAPFRLLLRRPRFGICLLPLLVIQV